MHFFSGSEALIINLFSSIQEQKLFKKKTSEMLTDSQHLHLSPSDWLSECPQRCSFPQMMMSRLNDSVEFSSTQVVQPHFDTLGDMRDLSFQLIKNGQINCLFFFCLRGIFLIQTGATVASCSYDVSRWIGALSHTQHFSTYIYNINPI